MINLYSINRCLANLNKLLGETVSKDKLLSELRSFNEVLISDKSVSDFLYSPLSSKRDKVEVVDIISDKLGILREVKEFIKVLIERDIVQTFKYFVTALEKDIKVLKGIRDFEVVVASDDMLASENQIVEVIRFKFGQDAIVRLTKDESIIAGIIINDDDKVMDLSLKSKLSKLKKVLINN